MSSPKAISIEKKDIQKAGNRSLKEILKIVKSVEKELKENPALAEKIFPKPHERVF